MDFQIDDKTRQFVSEQEQELEGIFARIDETAEKNFYKVLAAFHENKLQTADFSFETGYALSDGGRDKVDSIFADVFKAERGLCRQQFVSGTHAIGTALFGLLRHGEELLYVSGVPYDSLHQVIGLSGKGMGSLAEYGVSFNAVELTDDGVFNFDEIKKQINSKTKVIAVQRAVGYAFKKGITIDEIEEVSAFIKSIKKDIIVFVDNCYGEFVFEKEPIEAGADVTCGSLIKTPGGGIARTGGYIVGQEDLIEQISYRMTMPGIGNEEGVTFGENRNVLQGLFNAPFVCSAALKGAILTAKCFAKKGYSVFPKYDAVRTDICQAVQLGDKDKVINFAKAVQSVCPVDAHFSPEPCAMGGYDDEIIMASGSFTGGSTIELSADAPLRPPYNIYFQGGLNYSHSKLGVMKALAATCD
jgi:cystathionine beta-lyase family protein involved in aluminum resistance